MAKMICSNCGTVGRPKLKTQGSFVIEVFLWLMLLIPGIIYTLWRATSQQKVCPVCGAPNMVPLNTPIGKKLQLQFGPR